MNPSRRCGRRRLLVPAGLAGLALLLGGCVYLRLLEFKLQLGQFDRYFALRTQEGIAILCQQPVVRVGDVRWFGVGPAHRTLLGQAEVWQVRMVKQLPPGVSEIPSHDLELELGFAEGKLNRIAIPESYFTAMPKPFFLGVIRSFGRGKVDQSGKSVDTRITGEDVAAVRPKVDAVVKLLGRPTESRTEGAILIHRYRYTPATPEEPVGVFDMILRFQAASGDLVGWQAITPKGKIGFNLVPAP